MNQSRNIGATQFRDFLSRKTPLLPVMVPLLLISLGCNSDPEADDLGQVHPAERSAMHALYDGLSSFSTDDQGHVVAVGYDIVNLDPTADTFDDTDMAELAKLTRLKQLELPMMNEISDQGLEELASSSELEVLISYGLPNVTSEGFGFLGSLQKMKALGLGTSSIDDAGLEHLSALHELEFLDLSMAKVTDQGVRHLKHLERLNSLSLVSTPISDDSLHTISQLPDLEDLDVRGCDITDSGLAALTQLPRLKRLVAFPTNHGGGNITDQGLDHLKKIKTLEYVNLADNQVSESGAAAFRRILPDCELEIRDASEADAI